MVELAQADSAKEPRYRHDIRTTEAIKALTQCAERIAEMAELLRRGQYKLSGSIQTLANLRLAVTHLETAFRIGAKQ